MGTDRIPNVLNENISINNGGHSQIFNEWTLWMLPKSLGQDEVLKDLLGTA